MTVIKKVTPTTHSHYCCICDYEIINSLPGKYASAMVPFLHLLKAKFDGNPYII